MSGLYSPGGMLPSESQLKKEFKVSTITIRRAVQELALDGYIEKRQGIGSFVRDRSQTVEVVSLSGFTSDVVSGRLKIVRTLLTDNMIRIRKEIAEKLNIQTDSLVRHLVRLDSTGGTPFSIDEAFIPPDLAVNITQDIASSPLFMHEWQKATGFDFVKTEYDIQVKKADDREQNLLQIDSASPLLVTGELVFDVSGRPVMWIESKYPSDRCRLSGTVRLVQKETDRGTIGE
ncbi:MAG: GntR family transcriptional regulator [Candidatus Latescibacteria bacterium]|nr:GntR family transcriptional regulator [Candidatus Latescibacterota bacterium]